MPVREAVRTCCLSRNWRFAWSSIPELVYDERSNSILEDTNGANLVENSVHMVEFVDKFLARHDGSIHKFVISDLEPCSEALNQWMEVLSRKGIEEMRITPHPLCRNKWKVPSTFCNLQSLREVEFEKCMIELPQVLKGFKLLKSLKLEWVTINEGNLTKLISGCPVLENLSLFGLMHDMNITINAPRLKELHMICWDFNHVSLRTPALVRACLSLSTNILTPCKSNMTDMFDRLPNLESLCLNGRLTRYLTYAYGAKLSGRFNHLEKLYLEINFACKKEAAVARQFFQHAPNLEELTVKEAFVAYATEPANWEQNIVFRHLKFLKIHYFENHKSVLMFVKFLLENAPVLEKIQFEHEVKDIEFNKILVQLKRASSKVEIVNAGIITPRG
ncbi:F-box/FBD/LRR-repeat protein At1g13570-like [Carex rostrata]